MRRGFASRRFRLKQPFTAEGLRDNFTRPSHFYFHKSESMSCIGREKAIRHLQLAASN